MNPRTLRTYFLMCAALTIEIALAAHFVYLPSCQSREAAFPDVIAEADQIDLMPVDHRRL